MTGYAAKDLFQSCDDEDAVPSMMAVYRSGHGFPGTFEYEPIGADNGLVAAGLPLACLVSDPKTELGEDSGDPDTPPAWNAAQGSCEATFAAAPTSRPEHPRIAATTAHAGYLVLRLQSYPAWRVTVNGQAVLSLPPRLPLRADGLLAVPVPAGPVNLSVDWTATSDVIFARWVSGLSLLALTGLCLLERRSS
jgi:hypothetical protein